MERAPRTHRGDAPARPRQRGETAPVVPGPGEALLDLQRAVGNRALGELLAGGWMPVVARAAVAQPTPPGTGGAGGLQSVRFQAVPELAQVLSGTVFLRVGSSQQAAVRAVQAALGALGIDVGPADGIFGPLTAAGVRTFQAAEGLVADAVVGPQTLARLDERDAGAAPAQEQPPPGLEPLVEQPPGERLPGEQPPTPGGNGAGPAVTPPAPAGEVTELVTALGGSPALAERLGTVPGASGTDVSQLAQAAQAGASAAVKPDDLDAAIALLDALDAALTPIAQDPTLGAEVAAVKMRIANLRAFWQSEQLRAASEQVDSRLLSTISWAISQQGIVNEKQPDGVDPADPRGRHFRVGHHRLAEYFAAAKRLVTPEDTSALGKPGAARLDDVRYFENPEPPDWCGIFIHWAYASGGFDMGEWAGHMAVHSKMTRLFDRSAVRPGDLGAINNKEQHQFLVVKVEGNELHTIEGNTNAAAGGIGGQVFLHVGRRRLNATDTGYFRHKDALAPTP